VTLWQKFPYSSSEKESGDGIASAALDGSARWRNVRDTVASASNRSPARTIV